MCTQLFICKFSGNFCRCRLSKDSDSGCRVFSMCEYMYMLWDMDICTCRLCRKRFRHQLNTLEFKGPFLLLFGWGFWLFVDLIVLHHLIHPPVDALYARIKMNEITTQDGITFFSH